MESKTLIQCQACGSFNRVPLQKINQQGFCGKCAKALQHHMGVVEMQEKNFQSLLDKAPVPVLVDFWAAWCGPCQNFSPVFLQVAQKFHGSGIFVKMNTEENTQVPAQLGIRSIPTLMVFKNGQLVERISGAMDASNFESFVRQHVPIG